MWKAGVRMFMACAASAALLGAPHKKPAPTVAPLLPGEGLVLGDADRDLYPFGDTASEGPMGGLAHLVWVKLEGDAWAAAGNDFKCSGTMGPFHCQGPKGHGRVDLAKALASSCNLAFMTWAHVSAQQWETDYGEGPARARLVDAFQSFLGRRLPDTDELPALGPDWFGEGDLLRTSPEAFMQWLMAPSQEEAVRLFRRMCLSFTDEFFKDHSWWVAVETAQVPGAAGTTQAWAVGGNGLLLAVLRLPPGSSRSDALARFRALLMPKRK